MASSGGFGSTAGYRGVAAPKPAPAPVKLGGLFGPTPGYQGVPAPPAPTPPGGLFGPTPGYQGVPGAPTGPLVNPNAPAPAPAPAHTPAPAPAPAAAAPQSSPYDATYFSDLAQANLKAGNQIGTYTSDIANNQTNLAAALAQLTYNQGLATTRDQNAENARGGCAQGALGNTLGQLNHAYLTTQSNDQLHSSQQIAAWNQAIANVKSGLSLEQNALGLASAGRMAAATAKNPAAGPPASPSAGAPSASAAPAGPAAAAQAPQPADQGERHPPQPADQAKRHAPHAPQARGVARRWRPRIHFLRRIRWLASLDFLPLRNPAVDIT